MNKFILLICLIVLSCFNLKANNIIISYQIDGNLTLNEVKSLKESDWKLYESPIFKNQDTGSVWFRIIFKDTAVKEYIIQTPSIFIASNTLYNGQEILTQSPYQNLQFKIKNFNEPVYLKVSCGKRSHVPIEIKSLNDYKDDQHLSSILYTCYYSFTLAILFFTLLAYFQYRDKTYLIYIALMFTVNIARSIAEGHFSAIINNYTIDILMDQGAHILVAYIGYHFTVSFLDMELERRKKLNSIVLISSLISFILLSIYAFIHVSWFAFLSDLFVIIALISILFSAILDYKKSAYAKFYCFAFFPLMFAGIDVYFLEPLGIDLIPMNYIEYRVGIAFEMIVLSLAVAFKGQIIIREHENMRISIANMTKNIEQKSSKNHIKSSWKEIVKSEYGLTKQEFIVLENILKDKKNQEIADQLYVSLNTIKFHTRNIYRKLEINSKKEVIEIVKPLTLQMN